MRQSREWRASARKILLFFKLKRLFHRWVARMNTQKAELLLWHAAVEQYKYHQCSQIIQKWKQYSARSHENRAIILDRYHQLSTNRQITYFWKFWKNRLLLKRIKRERFLLATSFYNNILLTSTLCQWQESVEIQNEIKWKQYLESKHVDLHKIRVQAWVEHAAMCWLQKIKLSTKRINDEYDYIRVHDNKELTPIIQFRENWDSG
jgi:predicted DNA-binding protein YlxM (UPF0122 family)